MTHIPGLAKNVAERWGRTAYVLPDGRVTTKHPGADGFLFYTRPSMRAEMRQARRLGVPDFVKRWGLCRCDILHSPGWTRDGDGKVYSVQDITLLMQRESRGCVCCECKWPEQWGSGQWVGYPVNSKACFDCNFWMEKLALLDNPKAVRVNGRHYYIGNEGDSHGAFRGYGGSRFVIHFHDGRVVTTTNLWSNGPIPAYFRDRLPDNARFSDA